jgi:hypothetical protein
MNCRRCFPYLFDASAVLRDICPDQATPELMELSARMGSLMPYRKAADVLAEFLPIPSTESFMTLRHRTMKLGERLAPHAHFMIAPSARYFCPRCAQTPAIGRKDAALPWTFWCSAHGVRLWARQKRPMESFLPESVLERLDPLARRGAARLGAWAEDRDPIGEQGLPSVPELLQFLTASYRRSSPPSLAEQPRLSLEARRANHAFLTRPITRQALLVVAPEYNRFAPVLAKPVRPGLDALARGSLLQTYALAVAVARLTENLVAHAATTLAAADAEGEASLRRVLRSWPWATRRRIDTHLRRLLAANSATNLTVGQPKAARLQRSSINYARIPQISALFVP